MRRKGRKRNNDGDVAEEKETKVSEEKEEKKVRH